MNENKTVEMVDAGIAFSDAAHKWIGGRGNAGEWVAAQRAFADALGISIERLNDQDRRRSTASHET